MVYQALDVKIQSRKHILFIPDLLGFKKQNDLFNYLRKKPGYKEYLEKYDQQELHRGDLEVALNHLMVNEMEKMMHFMDGSYREFFKLMLKRYELHDLQLILRALVTGEDTQNVSKYFIHSKKYTKIDFARLVQVNSLAEFTKILKGTIYYDTLKTMEEEDIYNREWHFEMKVSATYSNLLYKKVESFEEDDIEVAKRILGLNIDRLNIEWIYRAKKYYNISNEEILVYSQPKGYKLSYTRLKKLIYTTDVEQFKKLANKYMNDDLFEAGDNLLEIKLDKLFYVSLNEKQNKNGIGRVMGYMYKLELILEDITAVAEGLRYNISPEEIKKYLVI
ncbi:MAG: hypothetical protein ATN33_03525 [Epulopiscium sp. Nele67-Bin001]|nr:MAG: hypothetical protein ATN33_03525 [Epulopiscium sp. Nele67-Bin001]